MRSSQGGLGACRHRRQACLLERGQLCMAAAPFMLMCSWQEVLGGCRHQREMSVQAGVLHACLARPTH